MRSLAREKIAARLQPFNLKRQREVTRYALDVVTQQHYRDGRTADKVRRTIQSAVIGYKDEHVGMIERSEFCNQAMARALLVSHLLDFISPATRRLWGVETKYHGGRGLTVPWWKKP